MTVGDLALRRPGLEAVTQLNEKEGSKWFSVSAMDLDVEVPPLESSWNENMEQGKSQLWSQIFLPPTPANLLRPTYSGQLSQPSPDCQVLPYILSPLPSS